MGDCGRRKQTENVLARHKKKSLSGLSMPPCLYAYTYARLHTACMLARVHAHLYAWICIERMQTCMRVHQIPRTHDGAQVRSRARRGRLRGVCICVCVYVCVCMCVSWSVNCHCGGVCVWVSLYVRFLRVCACDRKHNYTRTRCTDKKEHRGSAHTGNLCARPAGKRDKL